MAERVVDLLEPIEVQHEDGQLGSVPLRLEDRMSDTLDKQGAIG